MWISLVWAFRVANKQYAHLYKMSIKSFYHDWNSLSAFEQYLLKDRKMDLLIQEAIRSGEIRMEVGPVEFVPFINQEGKDVVKGQIKGTVIFHTVKERDDL